MKPVSVIIPVYGREDVFRTVAFLRAQPYAAKLRVVVVDNGNAAALSARLAALSGPDCSVVRFEENRGGSAAYVAGMKLALDQHVDAEFAWLLDDDAVPNAETLPQLVVEMERLLGQGLRVASVGSAVVSAKEPDRIVECGAAFSPLLTKAFPKLRGKRLSDVAGRIERVDYAAACSLLVNKAAVRACGFWEDVFIHFDDIEWGLRVTKAGWHNYATTASTVVHPEFDPEKAGPWICYFDARNQYWLASKYGVPHVASAWLKNAFKNLRARILKHHPERVFYRKLAWQDYRSCVRRTKAELAVAVSR